MFGDDIVWQSINIFFSLVNAKNSIFKIRQAILEIEKSFFWKQRVSAHLNKILND